MIRATLTISGDVQDAGYRGIIIRTGRKLGLVGSVENIPNGTVKVVCESEKKTIEEFVSKIKIKTETTEVEDIKVEYNDSSGEFAGKGFTVKIEESFRGLAQELFQGYSTSEKYFNIGWDKQDKTVGAIKDMHQELKGFREESKQSFDSLNKNLTGFRDETKTEFQTIKTDYGKISQDLGKAVDSINTIAKSIEKLAEAIAKK